MKETLPAIRGVVFGLTILLFLAMFASMGPRFFPACALFGAAGLVILVLTFMISEPKIQKLFFFLAGGAGTAALITLTVFQIMAWSGHPPGGDGGGITVPMLIIICPITFLIGTVGAIVCLIWNNRSKWQAKSDDPPKP
jgi:hypothetical protein